MKALFSSAAVDLRGGCGWIPASLAAGTNLSSSQACTIYLKTKKNHSNNDLYEIIYMKVQIPIYHP